MVWPGDLTVNATSFKDIVREEVCWSKVVAGRGTVETARLRPIGVSKAFGGGGWGGVRAVRSGNW